MVESPGLLFEAGNSAVRSLVVQYESTHITPRCYVPLFFYSLQLAYRCVKDDLGGVGEDGGPRRREVWGGAWSREGPVVCVYA